MGTGPHSTSYSPKFERLRTKRRPGTRIVAIPAHRFKAAIRGAGGGAPWTQWLDLREAAFDANEDGKFVAIPGLEWTKEGGHLCVFDPQTRIWPADPQAFYKAAADAGVVLKFNHPGDGTRSHDGLAYSAIGDRAVKLMEVRQAKEKAAFIRALNNGWHLAPDGSDDTHNPNWGKGKSWTGILAPGLSKRNILDALENRRCYSTLDRNCELRFSVNDAVMGIMRPVVAAIAEAVADN